MNLRVTYLGIDYGSRRIGLAVAEAGIAFPISAATQEAEGARLQHIEVIVAQREIAALVVGYPLHEDGSAGEMAAAVDAFIARLEARLQLPVYRQDEYGSSQAADASGTRRGRTSHSVQAQKAQRQSGERDSRAAAVILQDFLDTQGTA